MKILACTDEVVVTFYGVRFISVCWPSQDCEII